jgi:hypothetical protein
MIMAAGGANRRASDLKAGRLGATARARASPDGSSSNTSPAGLRAESGLRDGQLSGPGPGTDSRLVDSEPGL